MLLYIDSRAVVKLLNETVGNMDWQSEFFSVNDQLMCRIGIYDAGKQMWIWKSDTGSESNIEAEKGLVSDCYKRVLSRWGVIELYSAPNIVIPDDGYGNKGYKVTEIDYDNDRNIIHLVIANRFDKEVFRWDKGETPKVAQAVNNAPENKNNAPADRKTEFKHWCKMLGDLYPNVSKDDINAFYTKQVNKGLDKITYWSFQTMKKWFEKDVKVA